MTMAKSRDYWRKRFEMLEEAQHQKSADYYKDLEKAYIQTMQEVEKDIARWYQRFAKNNEISIDEAKQLLKSDELREFRWTVEEYIEYGKKNAVNQKWMKQLENASSRVHISRLESLQLQLQQHVEKLYGEQIEGFERLMKETYQTQYYHTAFEIQKAFEIGFTLQALDENLLTKVISKPWTADGQTFSAKIWRDRNLLLDTLHTELIQSLARGEAPDRMISSISKKMNTSRSNAARLVLTESAFFSASAQKDAFSELDVERYEIITTLDHKTSSICRSMDGKVFKMADFEPGITANPFHPRCRTTTAPWFEDDYSERIARDLDGETYYVPSNMKYEEWYQSQVEKHGEQKIANHKRKIENKEIDKLEYATYKQILGDKGPNSLDAFQDIKYNDDSEWYHLKGFKIAVERGDINVLTGFETYKEVAKNIQTNLVGLTTTDGIPITSYKSHFVDRIIGQIEAGTASKGKRSGVRIEDVKEALLNPIEIKEKPGSRQYISEKCRVSINNTTGHLIQTDPRTKG
ncbi:minor capsid protein [Lysinibacillus irui]|uniref:minor capsid protein n=1 Tax=Lysinibacillus irui TaxID=2998077 RepID=UPI0040441505